MSFLRCQSYIFQSRNNHEGRNIGPRAPYRLYLSTAHVCGQNTVQTQHTKLYFTTEGTVLYYCHPISFETRTYWALGSLSFLLPTLWFETVCFAIVVEGLSWAITSRESSFFRLALCHKTPFVSDRKQHNTEQKAPNLHQISNIYACLWNFLAFTGLYWQIFGAKGVVVCRRMYARCRHHGYFQNNWHNRLFCKLI